jgi:hypothetical protein
MIERKLGESKQCHGFGRCRYLGRLGFAVQAFLTAIMILAGNVPTRVGVNR